MARFKSALSALLCKKPCEEVVIVRDGVDHVDDARYLRYRMTPQSGRAEASIGQAQDISKHQNVSFMDHTPGYTYDVPSEMDPTRMAGDQDDAPMDTFWARPVKIATIDWGTGINISQDINPWELFIENKFVSNRMNNYNRFRGKLKVKFLINGNGFFYGRAIAAYEPLDGFNNFPMHAGLINADLVQTSQLPHVYLDPTTSMGGEMTLPFFWYEDYVSLPDAAYRQLGRIYLRSLNPLLHANGATENVTINVYAWMEDVHLDKLTQASLVGLQPQSGREVDEANSKAFISGPATAIAGAATAMSGIGAIAPYAMATATAANAVAGVAKSMGYCAPPMTKAPEPMRPAALGTTANTSVPQPISKLTLDDKQELSIDPRISGLGSDDSLNIRDMAMRESYLTKFDWTTGSGPDAPLWATYVTPITWAENGTLPSLHLPPCAIAALPFNYWTGKMRFRFQVVCSNFHKGRLRISYDPVAMPSTSLLENVQYTRIVDISKEQDFTIEVDISQTRMWRRRAHIGVDSVPYTNGLIDTNTEPSNYNGVLQVTVLNELTVPNSTVPNDIEVNVFVSAGDNFEVAVPEFSLMQSLTCFTPQSGAETNADDQFTKEPSAPMQMEQEPMGDDTLDMSDVYKVYFGEQITSFRSCLKRFEQHERVKIVGNDYNSYTRSAFPFLKGFAPNAVHNTAGGAGPNVNFVNFLLYHWIVLCHAGVRGGHRWKAIPSVNARPTENTSISVSRIAKDFSGDFDAQAWQDQTFPPDTSPSDCAYTAYYDANNLSIGTAYPLGWNGHLINQATVNGTLEFELPYYSDFRFDIAKRDDYTGALTEGLPQGLFRIGMHSGSSTSSRIDLQHAAAEDFQVYFWTAMPRLYRMPPVVP